MTSAAVARWEQVPWGTVKSVVTRLQALIYRASQEGNTEEMHSLQRRLLNNAHAKLLAVRRATELNQGEPIGMNAPITGEQRVRVANKLRLSNKGMPFKITRRSKIDNSVVRDRAKQVLTKLALEPEWEARFESGSFGYRPNRTYRDAMEAISLSLKQKPKYVLVADSRHLFQEMDHKAILSKLRHSLPALTRQIEAWLNGGIMELRWINPALPRHSDYGIITPLLANIALHGMETALKEWAEKVYPNEPAPLVVRFCEQFVVLNRSAPFITDAMNFLKKWLLDVGIKLDPDRYHITDSRTGFHFLGFEIIHTEYRGKDGPSIKTMVRASERSCEMLLTELEADVEECLGKTCHELVSMMAPKIERFGHYFKFSETHNLFRKMDHLINKMLEGWVFRKRRYVGNWYIKKLYYPSGRIYTYQGRQHQSEWVLADDGDEFQKRVHLPQLRWIKRETPRQKTPEEIMISLDSGVVGRHKRSSEMDSVIQLWSKKNLLGLNDEELEDYSQVMKVGNKNLWKALTDQDDGSHLYLYENPVFLKMKEDVSAKLKHLFLPV